MIFPIRDTPHPRAGVPVVTVCLIAINVVVYVFYTLPLSAEPPVRGPELAEYVAVMSRALSGRADVGALLSHVSAYDLFLFRHGFRPAAPSLPDLVYAMFLHAGFFHLAGNMLFLWIYGDNVEYALGGLRYLAAYLGTGIAATLFHFLSSPSSPVPMVGASGAISGILGFYFVFFPRNRVHLLWLLPPFLMQVIEVPARLVLGLYLVVDNLLPYLLAGSDLGVSHGAHIGGFAAGLGVAWVMSRRAARRWEERHIGHGL
jgi:membrane associated rhomboid family serine protease